MSGARHLHSIKEKGRCFALNYNNEKGEAVGRLIVSVTTANGAIPIEGAAVGIRSYELGQSSTIALLTTDPSGNTETIEIETPSVYESISPGGKRGYTPLIIDVTKDGYRVAEFIGAAVFPGVTTVQPVYLVPSDEYGGEYQKSIFTESEAADL